MSETLNINSEQAPISDSSKKTEYPEFNVEAAEEARRQRIAEYKAEHPDAIEDVDKARFMARAGDYHETKAALGKKRAESIYNDWDLPGTQEMRHKRAAETLSQARIDRGIAHREEDEAGEFYDEMKQV